MAAVPRTPFDRANRSSRRLRAAVAAVACAAVLMPAAALAEEGPAADTTATQSAPETASTAALPATLSVDGHGWGHGRGMGQYGSLGYATGITGESWDHARIVQHFYGGTTVGHIPNALVAVLLKARDGNAMVIHREAGLKVPGVTGSPKSMRATLRPDGRFDIQTGTTCKDTGTTAAIQVDGPVRIDPAPDSGTTALRLCNSDGSATAYNGSLVAFGRSFDGRNVGLARTVNVVAMDELMRGVVPRESPASWGDMAGGRGMAALRAQAVAARSYAAAGDTRWGDLHSGFGAVATTCDDTFCQVYGGLAAISPTGAVTYKTDSRSDRAVAETAGEVRMFGSRVARTEFSSSTGGYTAGGTFPAVPDQGDAVSQNPNHHWETSLSRTTIESRYGVGTLTDVQFLDRNGLGSMGGRVQEMRIVGTEKAVEVTGNQFRQAFALKSDWFDVTVPPPPAREPRSIDTACPTDGRIPSGTFSDVPADNVHRRAIDCVAWRGIAQGTSATEFSPGLDVTRAQMASFVARMIEKAGGSLPQSPPDAFSDDTGSVHEQRINQLAAVDVVRGVTAGSYEPKASIDRAQLASILQRAVVYLGVTLPSSPPAAFSDDNGSVHERAIDQLAAEGVVAGTGPGIYQPRGTAKRDQMASFIARALDLALSG